MTDYSTRMVDGAPQVRAALLEIAGMEGMPPFTLRTAFPRGAAGGNIVTWQECRNVSTPLPVVDEIGYQVEIWALDREALAALTRGVNGAMTGLGLRRQYAGPLRLEERGPGWLRRTLRFGRRVDKRTLRLID